jgi:diketogulonate reductase-like aldo/keto reductase
MPKATNLSHLEENAGSMGWRLSPEDIKAISSHFGNYITEYGVVHP